MWGGFRLGLSVIFVYRVRAAVIYRLTKGPWLGFARNVFCLGVGRAGRQHTDVFFAMAYDKGYCTYVCVYVLQEFDVWMDNLFVIFLCRVNSIFFSSLHFFYEDPYFLLLCVFSSVMSSFYWSDLCLFICFICLCARVMNRPLLQLGRRKLCRRAVRGLEDLGLHELEETHERHRQSSRRVWSEEGLRLFLVGSPTRVLKFMDNKSSLLLIHSRIYTCSVVVQPSCCCDIHTVGFFQPSLPDLDPDMGYSCGILVCVGKQGIHMWDVV